MIEKGDEKDEDFTLFIPDSNEIKVRAPLPSGFVGGHNTLIRGYTNKNIPSHQYCW